MGDLHEAPQGVAYFSGKLAGSQGQAFTVFPPIQLSLGVFSTATCAVKMARALPDFARRRKECYMRKSSCLAFGARTYYRPIEAAIRWSGLLRFEQRILEKLGQRPLPDAAEFPRWPMLRLNAERIFDAVAHGELAHGKAGIVRVAEGLPIDDPALTIRHVDLKAWMANYYPGEKPEFLFDDVERALHPAISLDAVGALLAEREAIKARLAKHLHAFDALRTEHAVLAKTHAACVVEAERAHEPGPRSESTYLNIIGGLLALLLGKSPAGTAYSSFRSMDAVVSALQAHHQGQPGLSERTLWAKLAQARRHLEGSR